MTYLCTLWYLNDIQFNFKICRNHLPHLGFFRIWTCTCDFNLSWDFFKRLWGNLFSFQLDFLKNSYGIGSEIWCSTGSSGSHVKYLCYLQDFFYKYLMLSSLRFSKKILLWVQKVHSTKYQSFSPFWVVY